MQGASCPVTLTRAARPRLSPRRPPTSRRRRRPRRRPGPRRPAARTIPAGSPRASSARCSGPRWRSPRSFVAWAVLFTDNLNKVTSASLNWVTATFGWTYLVVTLGILIFLVFLAFSPAGDIRLGKDTDRPEFSTITWFAMILSAVMGIGLVVVRRRRADLALRDTSARPGRAGYAGRRGARHAVLLLRLGPARLGDLRRLRPRHRLLDLPQGSPHAGQPALRAAAGGPRQRADRQGHRRARGVRDPVRHHHVAGPGRAAGQQRPRHRCSASRSTRSPRC